MIGTGPAGISAAYHLLLKGYPVDVFEANNRSGGDGRNRHSQYRLPKDGLGKEVASSKRSGGKFFTTSRLGRDFRLGDLTERGYSAVFLGIGTHKGKTMRSPERIASMPGYDFGIDFLL